MNLNLIDSAIASYEPDLEEGDAARLDFFRKLWGIQDACAQDLAESSSFKPYKTSSLQDLTAVYRDRRPVFSVTPVNVDADALSDALGRLTEGIVAASLFPTAVSDALAQVRWDCVVRASDLLLAGSNPSAWLGDLHEVLVDEGLDGENAHLGSLIASMALKVQLEEPAHIVMQALEDVKKNGLLAPLDCPVCGSSPMMAHVGGETSSAGRGRLLVCPQCAATWEFERVRCARCGTQNQSHLHFYNVEGDDSHRIATCDKCGGYIRTLYSEENDLTMNSYEVEDVLMARLDAIAQQPNLAAAGSAEGEKGSD